MTRECRFCAIGTDATDEHVVLDRDSVIAVLDANPAVPGHILVIPRRHVVGLETMPAELAVALFEAVRRIARSCVTTLDADGVSIFLTTGPLAGTIDHAHVHVLPRFEGDDLSISIPRSSLGDDAKELAATVRHGL